MEGTRVSATSRTPSWWSFSVFPLYLPSSADSDSPFSSDSVRPRRPRSIVPIVLISPESQACMHTLAINWLMKCSNMSATLLPYIACVVAMVTP